MRTLETIRMYNFAQKNHWQLMCDLSDNDYDIDYFSGRISINDDFDCFLQMQKNFNIHNIFDWLTDTIKECKDNQENKNKVHYQGAIDECNLLFKIVYQDYLMFNN